MPRATSTPPAHRQAATGAISLYQRLLPPTFFERLGRQANLRSNNRVYTLPVVLWLMIWQRLQGGASLQLAVLELLRGLPASFWPRPCKRLRAWRNNPQALSSHTGAYNKARRAAPLHVVEQSCDQIFHQLLASVLPSTPAGGRRAFFVDGTTVRVSHSDALRQRYPLSCNQFGDSHWPVLRMLVAHDLQTGLAMRPAWGPMHGPQAVSEQQLLEDALVRLPGQAVLIGDANFGVFSVAHAAAQSGHPVLLRLTAQRAQALLGEPLRDGIDQSIHWKPSRKECRAHPGLLPEACIAGRLLVRLVQPSNGASPFLLALFTTLLQDQSDGILALYGQRWNIETDLRHLKSTLNLDQLDSITPDMVAKELDLAMASYNLARAVACLAAQQDGAAPRDYSFTKVRQAINAFTPLITAAKTQQERQKHFDRMMHCVRQAILPKRKRKSNSYPREVWSRGTRYPSRRS